MLTNMQTSEVKVENFTKVISRFFKQHLYKWSSQAKTALKVNIIAREGWISWHGNIHRTIVVGRLSLAPWFPRCPWFAHLNRWFPDYLIQFTAEVLAELNRASNQHQSMTIGRCTLLTKLKGVLVYLLYFSNNNRISLKGWKLSSENARPPQN